MSEPLVIDEFKLLASLCRESFAYFVSEFWETIPRAGKCTWNWHMDYLCNEMQQIAERVFKGLPCEHNLVVNLPPGTSKSMIFSIMFPAWVWTRMPSARITSASHTSGLVIDLSDKSRDVIKSEKYLACFPEIILVSDAAGHYANSLGGERKTATVGGVTPTGGHAQFLLVDDPIDPNKVLSEAERVKAGEFMTNYIATRKVDLLVTVTLLVMQRLGIGDPSEIVLDESKKEGAMRVKHICLPSELEKDKHGNWIEDVVVPKEVARNYVDGLMNPVRQGREALKPYKAKGSHFYATQFLQRPYSKEGGMFQEKDFINRRVRSAPYEAKRVRYWDLAATELGGCNSAGVLMAEADDNGTKKWYVEDVVAGQWAPYERNQIMKATAQRDRAKYGPNYEPIIWIEKEGGASGVEAFQHVVQYLAGFSVFEHDVAREGSKVIRARPFSAEVAAGNVYLVDNGGNPSWDITEYIKEHCAFPNGKFLDRVDSSAGAFNRLIHMSPIVGQMRVIALGNRGQDKNTLRIVVCGVEQMSSLQFDDDYLLLQIVNPEPCKRLLPRGPDERMKGNLTLEFIDMDPSRCLDVWNDPVPIYNKKPEELIFTQMIGCKMWSFLLRKRDPVIWTYVFQDEGGDDDRAMTLAYGVVDALRLKRSASIYYLGESDFSANDEDEVNNRHLYEMVKSTRFMAM
jgi:predicted phage terminase large subunit-like protein